MYQPEPIFLGRYNRARANSNTYIFKIDSKYYACGLAHKATPKGIRLRCRKRLTDNCKFTAVLQALHIHDPNIPEFYDRSNFIVKTAGLFGHSCQGYDTEIEAYKTPKTFGTLTFN